MLSKIYVFVLLLASILEECFNSILPTNNTLIIMHNFYIGCGLLGMVVYLFKLNVLKIVGSMILTGVAAASLIIFSTES